MQQNADLNTNNLRKIEVHLQRLITGTEEVMHRQKNNAQRQNGQSAAEQEIACRSRRRLNHLAVQHRR